MSDIMLHSVLNMPVEFLDSPLDAMQYHSRGVEASKRIKDLEKIIYDLIDIGDANTGNEPSLSCWQRACGEAKQFIESTK